MAKRDIIVIGASAGGVMALRELVQSLPKDLNVPVFIVLHLSPFSNSQLPEILNKNGHYKAVHPKDGEQIKEGKIYVAPPDHHLLLEDKRVAVKKGPKENRFRPSVDALFRSAAYLYGPRVIGIVLTGLLDDGTSGLWTVKRLGGVSIVQDPDDAMYPFMPANALQSVDVDHVVPLAKMSELLRKLVNKAAPKKPNISAKEMELLKMEVVIASRDNAFEMGILNMGKLTPFTCPECHGALISLDEGKSVRFRCHTGHAFSASTLLAGVTKNVEETLWQAMRGLEETNMLLNKIGSQFKDAGNMKTANQFLKKAERMAKRAQSLKDIIFKQELLSEDIQYNGEE